MRVRGISTVTPSYPQTTIELPNFATDSAAGRGDAARARLQGVDRGARVRGGRASAPTISTAPRSTTSPPRWSSTGTSRSGCAPPGEAEKLLRDGTTTLGGRVPVNASGGLACFGEAVPAQAIAQVCELTWQVQGRADGRQVEGAKVGLSINQGLFGHGSSVIVSR